MKHKSKKVLEAEKFVDDYTAIHGFPPTYELIAKELGISKTSAFHRCAKFRDKMNSKDNLIKSIIKGLDKLSDDERMMVFMGYCMGCGSKAIPCYCMKY